MSVDSQRLQLICEQSYRGKPIRKKRAALERLMRKSQKSERCKHSR